jgi:hypothetical protein
MKILAATVLLEQLQQLDSTINATNCPTTLRAIEADLKPVAEVASLADALLAKVSDKITANVVAPLVDRNTHVEPALQQAIAPFLNGSAFRRAA